MSIVSTVQPDLRRKKINGQKLLVIFLFAVVPLFLLILFTYIPFAKMIQFSFHNMSYTKDKGIVGFDNYLRIFTKSEYVDAMLLSLYYMAGAVVQLALSSCRRRQRIRASSSASPGAVTRTWRWLRRRWDRRSNNGAKSGGRQYADAFR